MVYFIADMKSKMIKIGHSHDPEARLKELQTGNGNRLKLIHVISEGGDLLEAQFHREFESLRVEGEWFKANWRIKRLIENYK